MIMNMVAGGKTPSGTTNITANGTYDVTNYASANVDVVDKPVLLWSNSNPSASFAAQTVNLNGSGYSAYLVEIKRSTTLEYTYTTYVDFGYTGYLLGYMKIIGSSLSNITSRKVDEVSSSKIVFGDGKTGGNTNNSSGIPINIWGVKYTL